MTIDELVDSYIENTREVLRQIRDGEDARDEKAESVLDYAKRYLEDAEYYRDQKRFETGLASIAYCEGLLDALRLLGIVKFEWPPRKQEKNIP
jgi:FAD synthetase